MDTLFFGLAALAAGFVLLTLIMGARSMGSKAPDGAKTSNKWMQRRVLAQFAAIGFLFLAVYFKQNSG